MEECAELQKDCSKALRFGLGDTDPAGTTTNRAKLNHEANDVRALMYMLTWEGVDLGYSNTLIDSKVKKVEQFMEYSRKCGVLEEDE
jgi:hypothetical protein